MLKRVLSAVLIMSVMFALPSWGASFRKMNDEQFWYLCHEGSEGVTPLMIVRTPGAISALVKAGADVNARNRSGQTPLMFAAQFNTNPEVINALVDGGAEDLTDKDGKTALVHAKEMGTSEIIDALIKAGAYIPDKYYRYRY